MLLGKYCGKAEEANRGSMSQVVNQKSDCETNRVRDGILRPNKYMRSLDNTRVPLRMSHRTLFNFLFHSQVYAHCKPLVVLLIAALCFVCTNVEALLFSAPNPPSCCLASKLPASPIVVAADVLL